MADNSVCVKGLSETFKKQDKPLQVLVECDTGALRCGVVTPEEAFLLAQEITDLPGLRFGGLMTYPPISQQEKVNRFLNIAERAEDLVLQNKMQRKLGQLTGTCFQRCLGMDALNSLHSTTFEIDKKKT